MITLSLGFGVALSNAKDWTPLKKAISIAWLAVLDAAIILAITAHY